MLNPPAFPSLSEKLENVPSMINVPSDSVLCGRELGSKHSTVNSTTILRADVHIHQGAYLAG